MKPEAIERWPREEVGAAYDSLDAGPEQPNPASEVFAELEVQHHARIEGRG